MVGAHRASYWPDQGEANQPTSLRLLQLLQLQRRDATDLAIEVIILLWVPRMSSTGPEQESCVTNARPMTVGDGSVPPVSRLRPGA